MMEDKKIMRLNSLFEKMVASSASAYEKNELQHLYEEFINDGRESAISLGNVCPTDKLSIAS